MSPAVLERQHLLGAPLATYRYDPLKNSLICLTLAVGGVGVLLLSLVLIWMLVLSNSAITTVFWIYVGLLGVFAAIACMGLYRVLQHQRDRQIICERGLRTITQGKVQSIPYRDIKNVFQTQIRVSRGWSLAKQRRSLKPIYTYRFELHNGTFIKSPFQDVGEQVKAVLFPRIMQQISQTYPQGKTVQFGPLSLSVDGLIYGPRQLPWIELQSMEIGEIGELTPKHSQKLYIKRHANGTWIKVRNSWAVIELGEIPNFALFQRLVEHLQQTSGVLGDTFQDDTFQWP